MNLRYLKNNHDLAVQDSVKRIALQGTVVGTARQNISMAGCCRLPLGTASRSVRVLLKVPYLHYFSPLPRPSLDEKTRSITVLVVVPASRSEGALHQGKAHWLDLPLQPLPPCIKRRAAYSVLLTERLYRLPTLLLTGNQLAPVLPSLRHPLLVAHATTMRPSTPCGLVVFRMLTPNFRRSARAQRWNHPSKADLPCVSNRWTRADFIRGHTCDCVLRQ
jgi:hypothetical protein